jgi:large subunit ribosomal protein L10
METKKVSPNRAKKEQIVAKLADKVGRTKGLVFTNYQGLNHKQLEQLKKALKQRDAELAVTKNTLLSRALEIGNWKLEIGNSLQGPTATIFLYSDPIEPLKQLAKTIKELNLPTIKLGIIEGQSLGSDQVLRLAALPPHDVLIARLLYQMKAPIYRLHRALGWNMQKLVMTLKAIEKTKVS